MKASERFKKGLFNYYTKMFEIDKSGEVVEVHLLSWDYEKEPAKFKVKGGKIIYDQESREGERRRPA